MENKTSVWGEFYETLKEMEANNDLHNDENLTKSCKLIDSLIEAKDLETIREHINFYKLSQVEIDRINSKCLDGIIASVFSENPMRTLIEKDPRNTFTCNYYLDKKLAKRCLLFACEKGAIDIVKIFVERGANLHSHAVFRASKSGNTELVKFLIEKGAKISNFHRVDIRNCPLCEACKQKNDEMADLIIHSGFYCNISGSSHGWDFIKNINNIRKIIEKVGLQDLQSCLLYAASHNFIETVNFLLEREIRLYTQQVLDIRPYLSEELFMRLLKTSINVQKTMISLCKKGDLHTLKLLRTIFPFIDFIYVNYYVARDRNHIEVAEYVMEEIKKREITMNESFEIRPNINLLPFNDDHDNTHGVVLCCFCNNKICLHCENFDDMYEWCTHEDGHHCIDCYPICRRH